MSVLQPELVAREFDERKRKFCQICQEYIFQNPKPVARLAVLNGRQSLFVKRGDPPHRGKWTVPGGVQKLDEAPAVTATRELEEETTLRVSPEDIELARTGFHVENPDEGSILSIWFAVEYDYATGAPKVGDEPTAVRFWNPQELVESDQTTRLLDLRNIEVGFGRVRNENREFVE